MKGPPRCTLLMHPATRPRADLHDGERRDHRVGRGRVDAPVEISDEMMPGVVSLPHGWGHDREGARLRVAGRHAGVSVNDVTDERFVDVLTGTAAFSGVAVTVRATVPRSEPQPVAVGD